MKALVCFEKRNAGENRVSFLLFETGPEEPELEGKQLEKKSKAAQTRPKKLIRRTCPSGHGSDVSGPKWHAPPCSESAAQKKSFRSQRRGVQRSPSGDPEEESPIPEQLRDPICVQASVRCFITDVFQLWP